MKHNTFYQITFLNSKPNTKKTKFGGQPDWITHPEWPISATTGNPMRFICQIELQKVGYGKKDAKFAYLFMTDEDEYVDGTWEADSGENAIILQPGTTQLPTIDLINGPTL